MSTYEDRLVRCKLCGISTHNWGTELCNDCWKVYNLLPNLLTITRVRDWVKELLETCEKNRRTNMADLQLPITVPLKIITLEKAAGEVVRGTAELLNAKFHIEAIKVTYEDISDADGVETSVQVAVDDPSDRLYELEAYIGEDCQLTTVELPGYDGEWVISLTPACD